MAVSSLKGRLPFIARFYPYSMENIYEIELCKLFGLT